ncbi:thiol:disulfide interchange protein [Lysobacteraceae bacterium NML120232]|nr:thiol:disulfide interchange protein [Xanthomonadaceae bacterium NML08-0793]PJK12716.1 thiol:disulfide interchange protein [Xanthomonadaceae bacterium NML120232]
MKYALPLTLPLALALAACNKPAEAPAADTAAPPTSAQAEASDNSATAPEATPSVAAETGVKQSLTEGVDYLVIANGQPLQPLDGKVEVVEVFAYWCGHCAAMEPLLHAWQAKLPADVRFTQVPLSGGGQADVWARIYYAAETTHQLDKVQATVFDAMHNSRSLTPNASQEQILDYLGKKGVDTQAMSAAMSSFSMSSRLSQGLQFANRSGVEGTPTLIVNGKYRVLGRTHEDQLQVVNTLIAQERNAAAAP